MKRLTIGLVLTFFMVSSFSAVAEAGRKKKKATHKEQSPPKSEAIAPAMGDIKWGMSRKKLEKLLITKLKEEYKPLIGKSKDAIEEDRLRHELQDKIKRIRGSFVSFDGQSTGFDLGFLRDEFTHNNGESMMVVKDANSQNFYFFINERLWKLYKAFDIRVFEGRDFDEFSAAVKRKFGDAKELQEALIPGGDKRHFLEWQDADTRLRAVDQTEFYGFYCLVFEEKQTLKNLASLRTNKRKRKAESHALVDAVTSVNDMPAEPDESPNIVDRITGKIRVKEQAPEEDSKESAKSRRSSSSHSKDAFDDLDF